MGDQKCATCRHWRRQPGDVGGRVIGDCRWFSDARSIRSHPAYDPTTGSVAGPDGNLWAEGRCADCRTGFETTDDFFCARWLEVE